MVTPAQVRLFGLLDAALSSAAVRETYTRFPEEEEGADEITRGRLRALDSSRVLVTLPSSRSVQHEVNRICFKDSGATLCFVGDRPHSIHVFRDACKTLWVEAAPLLAAMEVTDPTQQQQQLAALKSWGKATLGGLRQKDGAEVEPGRSSDAVYVSSIVVSELAAARPSIFSHAYASLMGFAAGYVVGRAMYCSEAVELVI